MHRTENDASNNSSIVGVVVAVTFLPRRCLARIGYTYRHTDYLEGFVKYAVEMGSRAMMCIPNFIKIGSGIPKLIGGIHRQRGWSSRKPTFIFSK
jgi:hypothetical protein